MSEQTQTNADLNNAVGVMDEALAALGAAWITVQDTTAKNTVMAADYFSAMATLHKVVDAIAALVE